MDNCMCETDGFKTIPIGSEKTSVIVNYFASSEMEDKQEHLLVKAESLKEDRAKFWAGQMSKNINHLKYVTPESISRIFEILFFCAEEYDKVIFGRVK